MSTVRGAGTSGVAAYSGEFELWGNRGDRLTNTAELAGPVTLGSDATLSFMANYQIEELWDFAFVQISTDGGANWTSLANELTTMEHDPAAIETAVAELPGLTGSSGGWIPVAFDLSAYEGQTAQLRFLYITDWGYNEAGIYIDEVQIADASGTLFADDLEAGADAWGLAGFEHTTGLATNAWALTFVNPVHHKNGPTHAEIVDGEFITDGTDQWSFAQLDTSNLRGDAVTVILSNRLPEIYSSSASYLLLVEKGNARRQLSSRTSLRPFHDGPVIRPTPPLTARRSCAARSAPASAWRRARWSQT